MEVCAVVSEQQLFNCLWAAAQLQEVAPAVLEAAPAIVVEIPPKINEMNAQELCSLEDLVVLQDQSPAVAHFLAAGSIMICAAARLNILLPKLKGNDLNIAVPSVLWSCAKALVYPGELLSSVAHRFGSRFKASQLKDYFGLFMRLALVLSRD